MRDQGVARPPLYKKNSTKQASKDINNNISKSNKKTDNNSSKLVCFE